MISALSTREYNYVVNCVTRNKLWSTLDEVYEVPTVMKREMMDMPQQDGETLSENEEILQRWFSGIKNLGISLKNYMSNKFIRFKDR